MFKADFNESSGTKVYQTPPQNKLVVKDIKAIIKIWPSCSSNKAEC